MNLARIVLVAAVCLVDAIVLLHAPPAMADIISDVAPPPPRVENVGHGRDGYVWAPGHWQWTGQAYRWVSGEWIVAHGKARWIPDQWEPTGAQWRYVPGHWDH